MKKIIIASDSTCDLSRELLEKYDIKVLPMLITLDAESLRDGIDVTSLDIFEFVKNTGNLPKTSAIPQATYTDWFKGFVEQGYQVIHFCISSQMSATYNNARLAAEEVEGCYPIDSGNLSTGIGQLAIEAAICRDKGMDAEDIVAHIHDMAKKLNVSFVIDTLKYLHKGGRCSSVAALGANLLSLKPCIEVKDGAMGVGKKYRGKMAVCLSDYVKDKLANRDDIDLRRIFVTHSHCPAEVVEEVKKQVKSLQPFEEVLETTAGCTVSTHCGPGTLGVLFFNK